MTSIGPGVHEIRIRQASGAYRVIYVATIGDAVHVACGTDHTIFVNKDGIAYTTGFGSSGQLGLGSQRDVEVARQVKRNDLFDTAVTWAGAGGQFSILAGPVKIE